MPLQLSVATIAASSNAGTSDEQVTVVLGGMLLITGGVLSTFLIVAGEAPQEGFELAVPAEFEPQSAPVT